VAVGADLHAAQPRVVELMVSGGRAEVPHDGLAAARQQREANELVHGPRADVGAGHVADVVEIEGEQRPEVRPLELGLEFGQALLAQARHVNAVLPVNRVASVRMNSHGSS
jgi:hypothetical protein